MLRRRGDGLRPRRFVTASRRWSLTLTLVLVFFAPTCHPVRKLKVAWSTSFPEGAYCEGNHVQPTADGGYIVAGTHERSNGRHGMFLSKTDAVGNRLWTRHIPAYDTAVGTDGFGGIIRQLDDDGYLMVGRLATNDSDGGVSAGPCLIRTDENGDTIWIRRPAQRSGMFGLYFEFLPDSGCIIAGWKSYHGRGCGLLRTDAAGDSLWLKTYEPDCYLSCAGSVDRMPDGGYILALSYDASEHTPRARLVKIDANGNVIWTRDGREGTLVCAVRSAPDGGFIATGYRYSYLVGELILGQAVYLVRLDDEGRVQWERSFADGDYSMGFAVCGTSDGGYAIAGIKEDRPYVARTDVNGTVTWDAQLEWPGGRLTSVVETPDGGLVAAGVLDSLSSLGHAILAKFNSPDAE